jgi:hypothetical protein
MASANRGAALEIPLLPVGLIVAEAEDGEQGPASQTS